MIPNWWFYFFTFSNSLSGDGYGSKLDKMHVCEPGFIKILLYEWHRKKYLYFSVCIVNNCNVKYFATVKLRVIPWRCGICTAWSWRMFRAGCQRGCLGSPFLSITRQLQHENVSFHRQVPSNLPSGRTAEEPGCSWSPLQPWSSMGLGLIPHPLHCSMLFVGPAHTMTISSLQRAPLPPLTHWVQILAHGTAHYNKLSGKLSCGCMAVPAREQNVMQHALPAIVYFNQRWSLG